MSDTPRTDALRGAFGDEPSAYQLASLARTLERESVERKSIIGVISDELQNAKRESAAKDATIARLLEQRAELAPIVRAMAWDIGRDILGAVRWGLIEQFISEAASAAPTVKE